MMADERVTLIIFCVLRFFAIFTIPLNIYILNKKHGIAQSIRKIFFFSYIIIIPAVTLTFVNAIYYLINDSFFVNPIFSYIRNTLQGTSGWIIRYSILFVLIERLIATKYWETYEKNTKIKSILIILGICLIILSYLTSTIINLINIDTFGFSFMGFSQSINFLLAWFLVWKNYQLKEKTKNLPFLSQRYQIVENIQILRFLTPFILLVTFLTSLGPLSGLVIPLFTPNTIIRNHIFYLNYDLYFFVSAFLFYKEYSRKNSQNQNGRKVVRIAWINFKVKPENITVKTALGKSIPVKQTLDNHFNELNNLWKV